MFTLTKTKCSIPYLHKYLLAVIMLISFTSSSYSQIQSFNNQTASWTDSSAWIDMKYPGLSINGTDINISGEIFAEYCLDFNRSALTVNDTLVISGNLDLKNTCSLTINKGGILIVLGDYTSNNKVDVINDGLMLVAGRFEMQGANSQGSFINNGELILFDTNATIKNGNSYADLSCFDNDTVDACLTNEDYLLHPIHTYISSLPYDISKISIIENPCSALSILFNKSEICQNEMLTLTATSKGIEYIDSLFWNFGLDAIPSSAYGPGPHDVYYSSSNIKSIQLSYLDEIDLLVDTSITVIETLYGTLEISGSSFDQNYPEYVDILCEGEQSNLLVKGDTSYIYHWEIPSLEIDSVGSYHLQINWNKQTGEQKVYVTSVSEIECTSDSVSAIVYITDCPEEDIYSEHTYAFTPNYDGFNDVWVIQDIENYPMAKVRVFDKTGRLVFESTGNYQNNWNGDFEGRLLPVDSYFFIVDLSAYQMEMIRGLVTILYE